MFTPRIESIGPHAVRYDNQGRLDNLIFGKKKPESKEEPVSSSECAYEPPVKMQLTENKPEYLDNIY